MDIETQTKKLELAYRAFDRMSFHFRELSTDEQIRILELLDTEYKWPKNMFRETVLQENKQ